MRYLLYFDAKKELSEIVEEHEFKVPAFLHSTIYVFHMDSEHEQSLIDDLSQVSFRPFEVEAQSYDKFSKNLLVLRLSRPDELLSLHKQVMTIANKYSDLDFAEKTRHYFGDNYTPHITLSRSAGNIRMPEEVNYRDYVAEFILANKTAQGWKPIQKFEAKK